MQEEEGGTLGEKKFERTRERKKGATTATIGCFFDRNHAPTPRSSSLPPPLPSLSLKFSPQLAKKISPLEVGLY